MKGELENPAALGSVRELLVGQAQMQKAGEGVIEDKLACMWPSRLAVFNCVRVCVHRHSLGMAKHV